MSCYRVSVAGHVFAVIAPTVEKAIEITQLNGLPFQIQEWSGVDLETLVTSGAFRHLPIEQKLTVLQIETDRLTRNFENVRYQVLHRN
jgi:hypothetical protein